MAAIAGEIEEKRNKEDRDSMKEEKNRSSSSCRQYSSSSLHSTIERGNRRRRFIRLPQSRNAAEKQRRDRMNTSLGELSRLIPVGDLKSGRVEKTDVIKLAVEYIRQLQSEAAPRDSTESELPLRYYRRGFVDCANEALRFLSETCMLGSVAKKLLIRLQQQELANIQSNAHLSEQRAQVPAASHLQRSAHSEEHSPSPSTALPADLLPEGACSSSGTSRFSSSSSYIESDANSYTSSAELVSLNTTQLKKQMQSCFNVDSSSLGSPLSPWQKLEGDSATPHPDADPP